MTATRTAAQGLTTEQLQAIRAGLSGGRQPRVVFTRAAGQIAGQVGHVVRLEDPARADDWVVVRFGRDELPFSPADLTVAARGASTRRTTPVAEPPPPRRPTPEFVIDKPMPAAAPPEQRPPAPRRSAGPRPPAGQISGRTEPGPPAGPPAGPLGSRRARPRPPKGPAGLTVTLAYADGEWTVAANQGSKAMARPYLIRPAEALKMVGMIDVPGVQEAVEQILTAERAQAERQAERLRAELAEIEARLAELRDAG